MKRTNGSGTIDALRDGRFRPRLSIVAAGGKRPSLGIFDTEQAAAAALRAAQLMVKSGAAVGGDGNTLASFGPMVIAERAKNNYRDTANELLRFNRHLRDCRFALWHCAQIDSSDVRDLRDVLLEKLEGGEHIGDRERKKVSSSTVKKVLSLLSSICEAWVEKKKIKVNPVLGVTVRKALTTHEPWTYLALDEQRAFVEAGDWMVCFAIGTGLRHGEMRMLELVDLHVNVASPHVVVRYGNSKGLEGTSGFQKLPPKNGKIRRVPLFGIGLEAAKRWLANLRTHAPKNPHGLVFPTPTGARWARTRTPKNWRAPLDRHLRWHDLRHTCASALVSGMWGRAWRLEEICALLGHSSITVTQRYAHLAGTALVVAAEETSERWFANGTESTKRPVSPKERADLVALWIRLSRVQAPSGTLMK